MSITYGVLFCKRLINPPRHVIHKYSNAMHLSIWRHHDKIWRTSDAARGGSTGFHRWKLYFTDKLGIMNKYFIKHLFNHNYFYIDQLIFFSKEYRCYVEMQYFLYWGLRTCLRNESFTRAYTPQIVISFWT